MPQCIICYKDYREKDFSPNHQLLQNQLPTIFIVKSLLQVPSTVCENLLKTKGNPSTWGIAPCSSCTEIVYEAKFIVKQIFSLKKRLKNLQDKCKTKVVESVRKSKSKLRPPYNSVDSIRAEISANLEDPNSEDLEIKIEIERDSPKDGDGDDETSEFNCIFNEGTTSFIGEISDGECSTPTASKLSKDDDTDYNSQDSVIVSNVMSVNRILRIAKKETLTHRVIKADTEKTDGVEVDTNDIETRSGASLSVSSFDEDKNECSGSEEIYESVKKRVRRRAKGIPEDRDVHCDPCNRTFTTFKGYNTHMNMCHTGKSDCPHCGETFKNRSQMINHTKVHNLEKLYKCDKCSESYRYENRLALHQSKVHGQHSTRFKRANKFKEDPDQTVDCTECNRTFKSRAGYKTHVRMVHSGPVTCEKCDQTFGNPPLLMNHMKVHESDSPNVNFMCELCPMSFKESRQLTVHQAKVHEKPLPVDLAAKITCDICNQAFSYVGSLTYHKATVHRDDVETNPTPFKCTICDSYSTKTLILLRRHIRHIHDKVPRPSNRSKPRNCPVCDAVFHTTRGINRHLFKVHGRRPRGKKIFKTCPVCKKMLAVSSNGLLIHLNNAHGQKNEVNIPKVKEPENTGKPSPPKNRRIQKAKKVKKSEDGNREGLSEDENIYDTIQDEHVPPVSNEVELH